MTAPYDGFVQITPDELWNRLHDAGRRFAGLLNVTPPKTRLPGTDWNATQVAGHVLTVLRRYTRRDLDQPAGLSPDAAGVATLNEAELDQLGPLPLPEIMDQIWQELAEVEKRLPRSTDLNRSYPFHGGVRMDGAAALGNLIGEFLVHGRDVALAGGRKWQIGARNAALILTVAAQTAPAYVAPDAPGDLSVDLRTPQTRPWLLELRDGRLTSRPRVRGDAADLRLFGRPEPLMLNLYGRIGMAEATARGVTLLGGRRPWRITRLPKTFLTP